MSDQVDVCIVGGGASGAIAAHTFAGAGLRVLLLEEGTHPSDLSSLSINEREWDWAYCRAPNGELLPTGRPWTARTLGGGMSLFAGIMFRLREVDFDASRYVVDDAQNPSWPISYDDLLPFYDEVEDLIGIARDDGEDALAPPSVASRMPAHAFSPQGERLATAGRQLGLHPFATPVSINTLPFRGRPVCNWSQLCNEQPCVSGARADVYSIFLQPLLHMQNVRISTSSRVVRVLSTSVSMVSGVEWLNTATNTRHVVRARHVVLAANAVQTAALLLRSSGPMAPKGLGNEKDCVGRRLSMKVSGYATGDVAYRPSSDVARTMHAGPHSTVAFSDFYLDDECPTGLGGVLYEARDDKRSRCPDDMRLRMHFLAADQPMQQNRVVLSNERDRYGIPRIVMDYRIHPIDSQRVKYLGERAVDILREAGARDVALESSEFYRGSRHLHGGCWAGNDESTSVVDKWGRVHSQENVHVVDGSYFPYAGGVNPTFTILANALRIARHLVSEMKSDVIDLVEQPEGSAL